MRYSANPPAFLKTLVLVQEREFHRVRTKINTDASVGWQKVIDIQPINDQRLSRPELEKQKEKATNSVIAKYDDKLFDNLIVQSELSLDIKRFESAEIPVRCVSLKTLLDDAEDILKKYNFHWRNHATHEWGNSSLQCITPDVWAQQFAELGYLEIAKHLLKSLRVVTDAELREAFKISDAERIGLNIAHAFFQDDEPGSSSIAIQNVLEHMYTSPDKVIKINLASGNSLANINADVLFVYEDGLWSGVELVERLNAICKTEHFTKSSLRLHFKYGATSDVGLLAARLCAKREGLSRIHFYPAKSSHHFKFLKDGINSFEHLNDQSDEVVRNALDKEIEPYAFQSVELWGEERENAILVCAEIGEQLVRAFLERKEQVKSNTVESGVNNKSIHVSDEKVTQLKLGAGSFASTIVFASSIPKPVLPLMWLQGRVTIGNKSVNWRPLFWDARRTGFAYA